MKGGSAPSADINNQLSQNLFTEATPMRQGVLGQGNEILQSGGASVLIPLIARALEGSKMALSNTLTGMDNKMGRMAGTPWGQRLRAMTDLQGKQATANIAPSMNMDLFSKIMNFAGNQTSTAIGGLSESGKAQATLGASENALLGDVFRMMGDTAQGIGSAMGGCWIAMALYGTDTFKTRLLRRYLNEVYGRSWAMRLYRRYGRQLVKTPFYRLLRPLFDRLYRRAVRHYFEVA